ECGCSVFGHISQEFNYKHCVVQEQSRLLSKLLCSNWTFNQKFGAKEYSEIWNYDVFEYEHGFFAHYFERGHKICQKLDCLDNKEFQSKLAEQNDSSKTH